MARVFEAKLSLEGMRKLTKDLRTYRMQTLHNCLENFVKDLMDKGIYVAMYNTGEFSKYIGFYKEFPDKKYNYQFTGIMIAKNDIANIARWVVGDDFWEEEVSSILMAEYGSGQYALKGWRGTFPNQTHAFDDHWWYATDFDANHRPTNWHISYGTKPTMPMFKSAQAMYKEIEATAQNAFARTTQ